MVIGIFFVRRFQSIEIVLANTFYVICRKNAFFFELIAEQLADFRHTANFFIEYRLGEGGFI